jgi:hypothetical protein
MRKVLGSNLAWNNTKCKNLNNVPFTKHVKHEKLYSGGFYKKPCRVQKNKPKKCIEQSLLGYINYYFMSPITIHLYPSQWKNNWASSMHVDRCHWLCFIYIHNNVPHHFWPRLMARVSNVGT